MSVCRTLTSDGEIKIEQNIHIYTHDLYYTEEDAYCVVRANTETESVKYLYKCSKADLLAGKPELTFVYKDESAAYFGAR